MVVLEESDASAESDILSGSEDDEPAESKKEKKENEIAALIDHDLISLLRFCLSLQRPSLEHLQTKRVEFGEVSRMKTLIFDLDETLVHAQRYVTGKETFEKDFVVSFTADG